MNNDKDIAGQFPHRGEFFGKSSGKSSAVTRFIQTSLGKESMRSREKSSTQSATFLPTPLILHSSSSASSKGKVGPHGKRNLAACHLFAASIRYFTRNPARRGAKSSADMAATVCTSGKVYSPSERGFPYPSQKRLIMPFMRGMLLFWEMMKEQSVSKAPD